MYMANTIWKAATKAVAIHASHL